MTDQAQQGDVDALVMERECPLHPPEAYAELRLERPVSRVSLPSGQEAWLVTRYEDVRQVLSEPRLSADVHTDGFPQLHAEPVQSPLENTFMRADGEYHQRVRRLLNKEFSVKRAEAVRPVVAEVVRRCLDGMEAAGRPADLISSLALPVPSLTIAFVLGIPPEDRPFFESRARVMLDTASTPDQLHAAIGEVSQYLDGLITRKETEPGDDLVSRLVEAMHEGDIARHEVVLTLGVLLVAGHESTAAQIGLSTLALLEHPDQLAVLREEPELVPTAVEELLRHQTVIQVPITRAAVEDVEIGGQRIRAGEGVLALVQSANRDERVFEDPDRLDLRRGSRSHIAFSFGPHQCVGHALARVELQEVFSALVQRFPDLRLAGGMEDVVLRPHTVGIFGVERLPIAW